MKKAFISFVLAASLMGSGILSVPVFCNGEGNLESPVWENTETEPFELPEEEDIPSDTENMEEDIPPENTETPEVFPETDSEEFTEETYEENPSGDSEADASLGMEEEMQETEGGYEPEGRLLDGTPNYVWRGEGVPVQEIFSDKLYEASVTGGNYMKNAASILNRDAEMSDSVSSLADGIHKTDTGELRAYKKGRYFKKGRFALDGKVYYADVNGYLLGGWLKITEKENGIGSLKTSDFVWKYCDPQTRVRFEDGYQKINGRGHYLSLIHI